MATQEATTTNDNPSATAWKELIGIVNTGFVTDAKNRIEAAIDTVNWLRANRDKADLILNVSFDSDDVGA